MHNMTSSSHLTQVETDNPTLCWLTKGQSSLLLSKEQHVIYRNLYIQYIYSDCNRNNRLSLILLLPLNLSAECSAGHWKSPWRPEMARYQIHVHSASIKRQRTLDTQHVHTYKSKPRPSSRGPV
jgi:hypothetical protein